MYELPPGILPAARRPSRRSLSGGELSALERCTEAVFGRAADRAARQRPAGAASGVDSSGGAAGGRPGVAASVLAVALMCGIGEREGSLVFVPVGGMCQLWSDGC